MALWVVFVLHVFHSWTVTFSFGCCVVITCNVWHIGFRCPGYVVCMVWAHLLLTYLIEFFYEFILFIYYNKVLYDYHLSSLDCRHCRFASPEGQYRQLTVVVVLSSLASSSSSTSVFSLKLKCRHILEYSPDKNLI